MFQRAYGIALFCVLAAASPAAAAIPDEGLVDLRSAPAITFTGTQGSAYAGEKVDVAGDVNGDGVDDLVVSAPFESQPQLGVPPSLLQSAGTVYVVFGDRAWGPEDRATLSLRDLEVSGRGFRVRGATQYGSLGFYSAEGIGDVNGDGLADLAMSGDPGAFVVYGKDDPAPVDLQTAVLSGEAARIGGVDARVTSAGDFDGDGDGDLAVADPGAAQDAGVLYVLDAAAAGSGGIVDPAASAFRRLTGAAAEGLGTTVAGAGDVNGDGRPDLTVTTGRTTDRGYVLFGGAGPAALSSSALGTHGFAMVTGTATDELYILVTGEGGDVNGDGLSDVVLGHSDLGNGDGVGTGRAWVVFGSKRPRDLDLQNLGRRGFTIHRPAEWGRYFGWSIQATGDLNGDGRSEVAVSELQNSGGLVHNSGRAFVIDGSRGSGKVDALDRSTLMIHGRGYDDMTGNDFGAGDVNADGRTDLLVSAPYMSDGMSNAIGGLYLLIG